MLLRLNKSAQQNGDQCKKYYDSATHLIMIQLWFNISNKLKYNVLGRNYGKIITKP